MQADRIYGLARSGLQLNAHLRAEIERAYIDTMGVLCAGWDEPVTRALRNTYLGISAPWEDSRAADPEATALTWGTAAHALDYDDVHMTSVTHPSAVLIPAIEAAARAYPQAGARRAEAFALGLAVNVGLGQALGFAHYQQGWHATSTIGAVAAGAAIAYLLDLDEAAFRSALAIAAAQSGGLQRNFGTMVKPLQAGLAAQAGLRAARLAKAGVAGPADVFTGANGFLAAFGGNAEAPLQFGVAEAIAGVSRKLFPCCYMAHRPVAAAIALHQRGAAKLLEQSAAAVSVEAPPGCLTALTIDIPTTGAEAKFSGRYTVAYALLTGGLGLAAFRDEAVGEARVLALARRVSLKESAAVDAREIGIDRGQVTVDIRGDG